MTGGELQRARLRPDQLPSVRYELLATLLTPAVVMLQDPEALDLALGPNIEDQGGLNKGATRFLEAMVAVGETTASGRSVTGNIVGPAVSSEAMVRVVMIHLLIRRLARTVSC